jgi:ParB family chromosome partitioning protein
MTTTSIPLKNLTHWPHNVRKTGAADGIEELAASIRSIGLLQSLVVIPFRKKKFAVVAGGRRLAALESLRQEGHLAEDYEVPCIVIEAERALEASLGENVMRLAMHPVHEFTAFLALVEQGLSAADVAAKFGVTEHVVAQRLKLARVHPAVLEAYREDETNLEAVMAFAVTDNHEAQLGLWMTLPDYRRTDARHIRAALTESEIDAADRRVRFVTLAAYEQAGGSLRRDLFTDGDEGIFVLQPGLLSELVAQKLEEIRHAVASEGWAWTEVRDTTDYSELSQFRRLYPEEGNLPDDLEREAEALEKERDALCEAEDESAEERLGEIDDRLYELGELRPPVWPEGAKEYAGAMISISYDGEVDVTRGLVKPEDVRDARKKRGTGTAKSPFSQSLIAALRDQRSAALAAELAVRPDVALTAIVHTLMGAAFYVGEGDHGYLKLRATASFPDTECVEAFLNLDELRTMWAEDLPGSADDLWQWCSARSRADLLEILALCVALCIDEAKSHEGPLAETLAVDMTQYFKPTAENYFSRISRTQIIEALTEVKGGSLAPVWAKASKRALAAIAEREIAETGWLPAILRTAQ